VCPGSLALLSELEVAATFFVPGDVEFLTCAQIARRAIGDLQLERRPYAPVTPPTLARP
jgi:hypothetical protein